MDRPLWTPSPERIARANMTRFIEKVRRDHHGGGPDYAALYAWSIERPREFWSSIWDYCGIVADRRGEEVVSDFDRMPGARWFPSARLNFAENLLRHADDRPAIIFRNESGARATLTGREVSERAAAVAASLRNAGVGRGDRIAAFLPNIPETMIAMLGAASLGAVWSSCSPDFGLDAVLDRFGQIRPRVLFAADGYRYNGRRIDLLDRVREIASRLEGPGGLEHTVIVPYLETHPDLSRVSRSVGWEEFAPPGSEAEFEPLPFDHPLYILYSSGTTGRPKCIVHGAGGTLIQHLKEHVLHTDLGPEDTLFYYTTCGWMMWNWLASGLASGAALLLYDGSPVHPDPGALWRIAAETGVTVFGTSAGYLAAVEKAGMRPGHEHDLSSLRAILSTGSPLAPGSFDYVYREVKEDLLLASISGGTDIISCFALGNPIGPVWRGELQCRGLGMKVEVLDEDSRSVEGRKGELCCTQPFPSMPVGFWDDPGGSRYHAAYFERFPNIWCHGDYAELTHHDGVIIHGRSDATLNPGGVRIGTAEIYRVVEKIAEVMESVAVGQRWESDVRVVLFVVLREGMTLDDALRERLRKALRSEASPRHVPAKIVQVREIPRTISGKVVELAVQNVVNGLPILNRDALARPEALDQFRDLPELQEP